MVGGKKIAETATNSAIWEKPDVHGGLATHADKIRPFFETLSQMKFPDADSCLQHLQASHLNHFIRITSCTKSLPPEVRDIYDKVADKIRQDGVKDTSFNTLAKATRYSIELHSVFESKRINPVVKKHFDPSFKKKYQEEHDLRALHGRDDDPTADTRRGRMVRSGNGVNAAVARQTDVDVVVIGLRTSLHLESEARSCVLLVTAPIIALAI